MTASNDLKARYAAMAARWADDGEWKTWIEDGCHGFGFDCDEFGYGVCMYEDSETGDWGWTIATDDCPVVDGSGGAWLRTLAEAKENAKYALACLIPDDELSRTLNPAP